MPVRDRIFLALAVFWTAFTVVWLGVITAMIFNDPAFQLGLGLVRTQGLAGLWVTVPSILVGIAGLILLLTRRTIGTRLLLLYSAVWTITLFPGMLSELPAIVRHPLAYCTSKTCMPWVIKVAITVAFALSALWYARQTYLQVGRS
ncbi:MAG TPA: hypothetical protein VJ999_11525 [Candidatus Sulfotelmatobacter sp.]|nr:hypothetical protein [Candidatus Sulfotelmatobacter sp.]